MTVQLRYTVRVVGPQVTAARVNGQPVAMRCGTQLTVSARRVGTPRVGVSFGPRQTVVEEQASDILRVTVGPVAISALRAVEEISEGVVVYAQPQVDSTPRSRLVLGIALDTGAPGATIRVARSGLYDDPSWSWTPEIPIVLGADGLLTQELPADAGILQVLGTALEAQRMLIRIDPPILLRAFE